MSYDIERGEFENFLARLDSDPTRAAEKYEELRLKLIKFFSWSAMTRAEDLADQAIARVAKRATREEITDIVRFALGMARVVRLEAAQEDRRIESYGMFPDSVSGLADREREMIEEIDLQARQDCLKDCLSKIRADDRELVVEYYNAEGEKQKVHRQRLAAKTGTTANGLRVQVARTREKLEACVTRCLAMRREKLAAAFAKNERVPGEGEPQS